MSIELVARAKKTKLNGDSTAKLLLIVLADYADDTGMAWPSVRTMATEVEKSDRVIQRALNKLADLGLIAPGDAARVRRIPEHQRPNVWQVLPDKPARRHRRTRRPGDVHDTTPGDVHDTTPGDVHDTTPGDVHDTTPGDVHDTTPVTPTTPPRCRTRREPGDAHVTQTVIEPPYEPSCESTRAQNPKPRTDADDRADRVRALIDLVPDDTHRALADEHGLDLDWELAKFRDRIAATGDYPADPKAALRNWLRRGSELAARPQPPAPPLMRLAPEPQPAGAKRHTHTYACSHVLRLLGRDTPDPDELSTHASNLLNQGLDPTSALTRLGLAGDDLDAIA